jgi:hypothetical protein
MTTVHTRLLVMRPGQPHETITVELPKAPAYGDLREILRPLLGGCEWPEHVTVWADFTGGTDYRRTDMFVDEDGHRKKLARNEAATLIYRRNALLNQGATDPEALSFIVGPAVLADRIIWT